MPPQLLPPLDVPSLAEAISYHRPPPEELQNYLQHLHGMDLSDSQKLALLQALWSIMSAFVDLAFGADPVQQVLSSVTIGSDIEGSLPSQ